MNRGIYILAFLIMVSPIALGCVYCWSFYLLLILINLSTLLILKGPMDNVNNKWERFFYAFLLFALFQLIPLPKFILRIISPNSVDLLEKTLGHFTFHPLSLIPSNTFLYIIGISSFVFLGIALWKRKWEKNEYLVIVRTCILLGFWEALFSIVKFISGQKRLLVIWGPHVTFPTGTLRNPDHFSALMEIILPISIGYVFYKTKRDGFLHLLSSWELIYVISPFFILTALLLSGSRAGLITLIVSIYAFFQMITQTILSSRFRKVYHTLFLILLVGVIFLGAIFTYKKGLQNTRKEIWALSIKSFLSYPVFGSGFSTYEDLVETFRKSPSSQAIICHAHNEYLEILAEGGIIGGILLIIPILGLFYEAYQEWDRRRYPFVKYLGAGGLSASIAAAFHSLFDFPLRIPSISLVAVVVFSFTLSLMRFRRRARRKR